MVEQKPGAYGIASLVLGILSIVPGPFLGLLGVAAGVLGIIFAVKQRGISQDGIATAGLVTSIVGTALSTLGLLMFFFMWSVMWGMMGRVV